MLGCFKFQVSQTGPSCLTMSMSLPQEDTHCTGVGMIQFLAIPLPSKS